MAEAELTYEEMRKKRLEENKKRMEELNLKNLSQALNSRTPKSSPAKPRSIRKWVELTAVRRSSRVADKPKPDYKDVPIEPLERLGRSHSRGHSRRDLCNRVYASAEERAYATERAEHIESTLESEYPSFVKPMLQSHVTGGFWLGFPLHFCKKNLPQHDVTVTLVDEEGEEFATKYLGEKNGLSAGWRGFSIDHNLVDGDALVFQMVAPTKFKVYIIRAYGSEDTRGGGEDNEQEDDKGADVEPEPEPEPDVQNRRSKRIRARK
ncbi:hypothetical protein like AT3G19184 [Hibiscus trionum]|uniref:TF-B3 domain-containing protein n=1 Tax=Hibiscus trionum TaxID=183268 RepID=A0A9W7HVD1_HIBTR|nr:hypothetical protein like AT3G19184 [Hibiscus trionum]